MKSLTDKERIEQLASRIDYHVRATRKCRVQRTKLVNAVKARERTPLRMKVKQHDEAIAARVDALVRVLSRSPGPVLLRDLHKEVESMLPKEFRRRKCVTSRVIAEHPERFERVGHGLWTVREPK